MTLNDLLIDKRTVRRNIEKGRLDAATYRSLLDQLPDRSANVWRPDASGASEPRTPAPAPAPAAPPPVASPIASPIASDERVDPNMTEHVTSMSPG